MTLRISLEARHLVILGCFVLVAILVNIVIGATGTTPINPGHPLSQTWIDTDLNMGGTYGILTNNICIGGVCKTAWPSGGAGWSVSGLRVYNNTAGVTVGIGTSTPGYSLDVSSGDINTAGIYRKGGIAGISAACVGSQFLQNPTVSGGIVTGGSCVSGTVTGSGTANYVAKWDGPSSLTNSVVQDDGTNAGVGGAPASPNYRLFVNGRAKTNILMVGDFSGGSVFGNYPEIRIGQVAGSGYSALATGTSAIWRNGSTGATSFASGIAVPLVMTDAGRVGINNGNPTATLDVSGSVELGSGAAQANKVLCWRADKTIGYCSTQPDATGACTCNAIN